MALSFVMRIIKTFTTSLFFIRFVTTSICSVRKFECFVPRGQKVVYEKYMNIDEEDLVVNNSSNDRPDLAKLKSSLLRRRKKEFKEDTKGTNLYNRLAFKPRFNFHDVTKYLTPDHRGVELKNVYVYTTPERHEEGVILRGLTVSAHRSDIVGIIGRTGAGKTTLLSALDNTTPVRTGKVLLDGADLNDVPKAVLNQVVGVLPQHPFVFKGWTVRRFLDPRRLFTDDEINDALHKCGLLDFVNGLEGGKKLESVIVKENLVRYTSAVEGASAPKHSEDKDSDMIFTPSQLRTVYLAKLVLYRKFFRLVLVDEPPENVESDDLTTTSVDDLGVPIYELVKKFFQHCTTFVTAHDSNALRACNRVWVLHKGSFIGEMSVDEVLKENSISNIVQKFTNPRETPERF